MFSVPILLYSKYCKECPVIMRAVDTNAILFLCVDNVDIRQKFLKDKKFLIRKVPSLLIYNDRDMSFEKYEGSSQVVQWLAQNNLLEHDDDSQGGDEEQPIDVSMLPQPRGSTTTTSLPTPIQTVPIQPSSPQIQRSPPSEGSGMDEEDMIPEDIKRDPVAIVNTRPPPPPTPTPPPSSVSEGMLPVIMEEGEGDPSGMSSDPSGMSDSYGTSSSEGSADMISKKPNNILNLAQQMQRERESSVEDNKVPGPTM